MLTEVSKGSADEAKGSRLTTQNAQNMIQTIKTDFYKVLRRVTRLKHRKDRLPKNLPEALTATLP